MVQRTQDNGVFNMTLVTTLNTGSCQNSECSSPPCSPHRILIDSNVSQTLQKTQLMGSTLHVKSSHPSILQLLDF